MTRRTVPGLLALAAMLVLAFGTGQALAGHVQCGDVITTSAKLDSDVVCPDGTPVALTIAADGVKLDLAGHSLVNGRSDDGETIALAGTSAVDRVTVRDGSILAGDQAVVMEASNSTFRNLTVNGHASALEVKGDGNLFRAIVARSSFHTLGIEGSNLTFERSDVSVHPNEELGGFDGDANVIRLSSFSSCGSSALSVRGSRSLIEHNDLLNCPLFVFGVGARIDRNRVTDTADTGINVFDPRAIVTRNFTARNASSGIQLFEPGAYVARNTAVDNFEWGINAPPGTIDGGGNRASGNGNAEQCTGVTCS